MSARETILLVEDGADERELFVLALEAIGLAERVETACDGAEALERLLDGRAEPLPAVVVLDLDLPRVHGLEVLRQLRGDPRTRTLPVVILTTSLDRGDRVACYELGANSFVHKAIGGAEFAETMRLLARYWLEINQTDPI